MVGNTGLIGNLVCNIRAALPMLPGVILDRICPPEEIPEGEDLILEGTTDYIEVTDLGDGTLQIRYYDQKSGMIVTTPPNSYATSFYIVATLLGDGYMSATQFNNATAQFHNLGY